MADWNALWRCKCVEPFGRNVATTAANRYPSMLVPGQATSRPGKIGVTSAATSAASEPPRMVALASGLGTSGLHWRVVAACKSRTG